MDGQRGGAAVRQRVGERRAGAAGAGHVEAAAFDLDACVDQSADKAAAIEQRAAEGSVRLAANGVDDLGMYAIALELSQSCADSALCGAVTMKPSRLTIDFNPAQPLGRSSRPMWIGRQTASIFRAEK